MKSYIWVIGLICFAGCGQSGHEKATGKSDSASTASRPEDVPLTRSTVSEEPVAEYSVRTENPLNDWYFQVRIYETPKTFEYVIRLQYEEIKGKDTLKLPNFGMTPKPVIKKGPEEYSCIIGFMDKENQFREYKKVYVKENTLKIEAIKHYGVRG